MTAPFTWSDAGVRDALGLPGSAREADLSFSGISTHSQTIEAGELFVALPGSRFDGHDFVGEAAARGARGAVVSRSVEADPQVVLYLVEDTVVALGALARHRRRALPARVVGITGSAGKTTVKNLLAAALSGSFEVHATSGNENNRIGVPLTLLAAPEDTEIIVLEMGTSEPGEIAALTSIGEPDAALLTTVGAAHLEGLGSIEGVLEEKLDLVRGTRRAGAVIVGEEPESLPHAARALRPDVRVAGVTEAADRECRGELRRPPDSAGRYGLRLWDRELRSPIPGVHGARNLVLALSMARILGAEVEVAIRRACAVSPGEMRGERREIGGLTLLVDCYNANPQSTAAALELLVALPGTAPRVAFLSSMLELGGESERLHRELLTEAARHPLDLIVATGAFAAAAGELPAASEGAARILAFEGIEAAYEALIPLLTGSERILLKGSRGTHLERLLPRFEADFGGGSSGGVA